jgi:hypothetical protein
MHRVEWERTGEVTKWTDVPLQFPGHFCILYVRSLTLFVFQYIFLSCHHLSYIHLLIPFVCTKRENLIRYSHSSIKTL